MTPAAHPNPYRTPSAPHPQPYCATRLPHASDPFRAHHSHSRHLLHANPSFHYRTALPTPSERVDHAAALLSLPARPDISSAGFFFFSYQDRHTAKPYLDPRHLSLTLGPPATPPHLRHHRNSIRTPSSDRSLLGVWGSWDDTWIWISACTPQESHHSPHLTPPTILWSAGFTSHRAGVARMWDAHPHRIFSFAQVHSPPGGGGLLLWNYLTRRR